jgi:MarR family transcriptional regulator, organic hydroperoxide resistance regulator
MFKSGELHILMVRLFRSHYKKAVACLSKEGITVGQPRILDMLWENDGCIQKDIAVNCNLEAASVTSVLATMERDGLIERRNDPADRRVLRVWLTEEGKRRRTSMRKIFNEIEEQCFTGFSEEEKVQAGKYLMRIFENLNKDDELES